jgi:hypothetical protein
MGSRSAGAATSGLKGSAQVTDAELAQSLATYGAGLQAELALLHQLESLALSQRQSSVGKDMDALSRLGEQRSRLTAALVQIEHELKPARETIAKHLAAARRFAVFSEVLKRHRMAGELVARILESDRELLQQLQAAELARRDAAHAIETGENTLNAYRRVIAPSVSSVGLVNRRG